MAKSTVAPMGDENAPEGPTPRSVQIASRGIRTADDAANFQSALLGDVMTGSVTEKRSNAACNAMGKLLKIVDMKHRYGGDSRENNKPLQLADPDDASRAGIEAKKAKLKAELAQLEASGETAN